MGIIRAFIELFSNREEDDDRVSRKDLGNGFYITYGQACNGMGYYDVNLCLHNENDPSFHRQITNYRGDFISFPGYVNGTWEKSIEVNFSESVRYPSHIGVFKDGKAEFGWQIQPDGRYFADEDGFGMENCEEIWLRSYLDENGNFTEPFAYYR